MLSSREDAGRSEIDFLCRIIEAAIDAGAARSIFQITVGYAIPEQFGHTIKTLLERIPNAHKAIFSVHCHNDLGLAVANSLSVVANGYARQVDAPSTVWVSELATPLEEIVMAVRTRQDLFGISTGIDTTQIVPGLPPGFHYYRFPQQPKQSKLLAQMPFS